MPFNRHPSVFILYKFNFYYYLRGVSTITPEQQKLVENNHRLIYEFIKIHNLSVSEHYDLLAISLCKAAIGYKNTYAFSTYAFKIMRNDLWMEYRDKNALKRIPDYLVTSYNESVDFKEKDMNDKNNKYEYTAILKSYHNTEEEAVFKITFDEYMKAISPRDRTIIAMAIEGYNYQRIADSVGVSRTLVTRIVNKMKTALTSY